MPNPVERTVMRHLKTTTTLAAALAVVTLTATSCSSDPAEGTTSTSTASSSSNPSPSETTYDDEHAFTEAEKAAKKAVAHPLDEPIAADDSWASGTYRASFNAGVRDGESQGITLKGSSKWVGSERGASNREAAGGWDLTMNVCSSSTVRGYKDGKDVSLGADGKPLPKGSRDVAYLYSFTTPDKGKTWQVNDTQQVEGETCDK